MATDGDLSFRAEKGLLEFDRQIFAQIGAALHSATTASTSATEQIAETKEIAKYVAEILKNRGVKSHTGTSASPQAGMTVAIVDRTLFRISEHRIRLTDFFELLLSVRIVGIAVRMILEGQFAVGALQFNFGARASHTEYFVIITFCVCCQDDTFPSADYASFGPADLELQVRSARNSSESNICKT